MIFPLPIVNNNLELPPTIYSIMESIVNYGQEEKTKIINLSGIARTTIFNFNYPLSDNVVKADFETQILNHFIMRRINFDTVTLFQIMLNNKLNEIMPKYNILFDSLEGWELFKGSTTTRTYTETGMSSGSGTNTTTGSNTNNSLVKSSDTPQSDLDGVLDDKYISNFEKAESTGNNSVTGTNTTTGNDSRTISETVKNDRENESELIIEFSANYANIMTQIYNELEPLFYGLVY